MRDPSLAMDGELRWYLLSNNRVPFGCYLKVNDFFLNESYFNLLEKSVS